MSGGGDKIQINNTENKVGALRVQQSTQGVPIPLAYGLTRVTPNMIWYRDFRAIPHVTVTESGGGGGKGGGGGGGVTTTTTTYTYTVAVILALCEGPIGYVAEGLAPFINQVWQGKEKTGGSLWAQFYGDRTQLPYSYVTSQHPTEALGYRDTAYAAQGPLDLGTNTSLPNFSFEIWALLNPTPCTPDVNPADVLLDILLHDIHGTGCWREEWVHDFFDDFYFYCRAANFLCAPVYASQVPAADMVKELCAMGNSAPLWSDGKLKVIPYGDETLFRTVNLPSNGGEECDTEDVTWVPDLTVRYALTDDDFIADVDTDPVRVLRKRPADAFNKVQVEVLDRDNEYNPFVCEAEDLAAVEVYGLRMKPVVNMHGICNREAGRAVAQAMLMRELYKRNEYTFQLPWRYARLEPMDIVSLTEARLNLVAYPVRITAVEEDEDGLLTITAEDLGQGTGTPGIYAAQAATGTLINSGVDPGNAVEPVIFQPPVELSGVPQIWMTTAGGEFWGGCQVHVSDDGTNYALMGTIAAPGAFGEITANVPAGTDPDTSTTISVDLSASLGALNSFTEAQADAGDSLSWLDGEIIAYTAASLTAPYNYDLGVYLRRGLRCSFAGAHETGAKFVKLNGTIGKFGINQARVGATLYVKLVSFNIYGNALQDIADVPVWEYVVQPLGIVAANGVLPEVIEASQVLCIPPNTQMSIVGRETVLGRINCDGRLIIL